MWMSHGVGCVKTERLSVLGPELFYQVLNQTKQWPRKELVVI